MQAFKVWSLRFSTVITETKGKKAESGAKTFSKSFMSILQTDASEDKEWQDNGNNDASKMETKQWKEKNRKIKWNLISG